MGSSPDTDPQPGSRRLVLVHAHPDDECIGTGGTIARYSQEGAHVCLVTCTNGEVGEIADQPELGDRDDVAARLGEVRLEELREACLRLGNVDLRALGYHDSGMAGTEANEDPRAFVNQDLAGAVAKVVAILREVRPQVLVTYNEVGFYGHPDHIRAHEVAVAAIDAAADPAYAPGSGPAHRVEKLYYTAIPRSLLEAAKQMAEEIGFAGDGEQEEFISDDDLQNLATDDEHITTEVDVVPFVGHKFSALEAHRTQLGTTKRLLEIPEEFRVMAMGVEHYVLVRPGGVRPEGREKDLFEGLGV